MSENYQICTRTIMDTSDPNIRFNAAGESDYYTNFQENILPQWNYGQGRMEALMAYADLVRKDGKGKDFDCIIGVSGGLDSSYAVYVTKEIMGLRPLIYHVDAGWNTQQAVANIEKLLNGLSLELYTDVINWNEMRDLQRAFLLSQTPDQDSPQDIAFFSSLYQFARNNGIKHIFTGSNFSTECVREPEEWAASPGIDKIFIKDIHSKFGTIPLKTFPIVDIFTYKIFYKYILGVKVFYPLNYVPYRKAEAEQLLSEKFAWQPFLHKHHESRFTRFFEDYWLPRKFGYEKRRAHFSSLILTGQMTRDEALMRISKPELDEQTLINEKRYIAEKLGFTDQEFNDIFHGKNKQHRDYRSKRKLIKLGARMLHGLGVEKRLFR